MNITVIYGTNRTQKSTTYHIAKSFLNKLSDNDKVNEFFLPKDMNQFCLGCFQCFNGNHEKCPAYNMINSIRDSMNKSDLIIFTAPVYVYHAPGQVKAFLDHFGWEWCVHQPNGKMFSKQVLIISTAAGAGMKSTVKDIKDSMDFWGVAKVYNLKAVVSAANWDTVNDKIRKKLDTKINKLSNKIKKRASHVTPRIKVKLIFYGCRLMHKYLAINEPDVKHWKEHGWLDNKRPWK